MQTVSAAYRAAAIATVRRPRARVTVTWTDALIDTTIQASATDENRAARLDQVADQKLITPYKWAHLDDTIVLDGSFYPMPKTADFQVGWWGQVPCSGASAWAAPYPTLTVSFADRPVATLLVVGDSQYDEFPVDFTIKIYNNSILKHTETVTGNTLRSWTKNIDDVLVADKMTLEVRKWSAPDAVVKIVEFYSGLVSVYDGEDGMLVSVQEERELSDSTLPVGNISANECELRLQNVTDLYFNANVLSLFHTLVKKGRRIFVELGFELPNGTVEYTPYGTYWSGDWSVPENGTYASTSARDRMELLRKRTYSGPIFYNVSLYDLAVAVLTDAKLGMEDLNWNIDTALQAYPVEWAWFPAQSYMDCLRDIAGASMGQAYFDRLDVLQITGIV